MEPFTEEFRVCGEPGGGGGDSNMVCTYLYNMYKKGGAVINLKRRKKKKPLDPFKGIDGVQYFNLFMGVGGPPISPFPRLQASDKANMCIKHKYWV